MKGGPEVQLSTSAGDVDSISTAICVLLKYYNTLNSVELA